MRHSCTSWLRREKARETVAKPSRDQTDPHIATFGDPARASVARTTPIVSIDDER